MTHADQAPTGKLGGELLQLEIVTMLTELLDLVPQVAVFADSHQPGLGFLSYEARQAQDAMVREERTARIEAEILGRPQGHGATATPGNWSAIGVHVEIWAAAFQSVDRLVKHLGLIPRTLEIPEDGGTAVHLLRMLRPLVWETTDDKVLRTVLSDLTNAHQMAENLVGGNSRIAFDGKAAPAVPCPHCEALTLVATFKNDVLEEVRCGKDPHTGANTACICPDPLCGCKTRPRAHRHTWTRVRGNKPDGLLALWKLVDHAKQTKGPRP